MTVKEERSDLLRELRVAFKQWQATLNQTGYSDSIMPLPEPLAAEISGKNATIRVSHSMCGGDTVFAEIWYRIYHKHHFGIGIVRLKTVWAGGTITTIYPPNDLF